MPLPTLFIRVLRKLGLLRLLNVSTRRQLNGRIWTLPLQGNTGYDNLRDDDAYLTELLTIIFPHTAGLFLDVGANVGQTLLKALSVDPQRHYIGFEPNPSAASYVNALIQRNRLGAQARVFCAGLSSTQSLVGLDLYDAQSTSQGASVVEGLRPHNTIHQTLAAVLLPGDVLREELHHHDLGLVKIDVEGAELSVIRGLANLLKRDRPLIIYEVLPAYSTDYPERIERQDELQHTLRLLKYQCLRIHNDKVRLTQFTPIGRIEVHDNYLLSNYLAVPLEFWSDYESLFLAAGLLSAPVPPVRIR